jgi:hypothetical protein
LKTIALKTPDGRFNRPLAGVVRPHNKNEPIGTSGQVSGTGKFSARRRVYQHIIERFTQALE